MNVVKKRKYRLDVWLLGGARGSLDTNETIAEAAARETFEEVDILIILKILAYSPT